MTIECIFGQIGGGAAGLSAAYALKKRGVVATLQEADAQVGRRGGSDLTGGSYIDTGAYFYLSSYNDAFRVCGELGRPLVWSKMKLGWYRDGQRVMSAPTPPPASYSRKSLSFLEREGCRSFRRALASIWRMRSRVTPNSLPPPPACGCARPPAQTAAAALAARGG